MSTNSLFEQYLTLKSAYDNAEVSLHNFVSDKEEEIMMAVAKELKKVPGMNRLILRGFTPYFNDGDACYHSGETYYICNEAEGWFEFREAINYVSSDFFDIPEDADEDDDQWLDTVNTYSEDFHNTVNTLCRYIESLVESLYETNYLVLIDFTTDEPTITYTYYDPGY